MAERGWGGSLHQTFRLFPEASANLRVFLEAEGLTPAEILDRLPYDASRSRSADAGSRPDAKRYRDSRHVYQSIGLVYEVDGIVRVTELGLATARWIGCLTPKNSVVLGRHAAYALTACQLRNPSRAGSAYQSDVEVFPFTFIWRAMLNLEGKISSAELNRVLFGVNNTDELELAIAKIADHRMRGAPEEELGPETITGRARNDRIIPWMALASFGWLLIADKRETGGSWYEIRPTTQQLLSEAAQIKRVHRDFGSLEEYVLHVSDAACLPRDVR